MRKLLIPALVIGLVLVGAPARAAVPRTYVGPGGLLLDGRTLTLDEIDGEFAIHLHAKVKATQIDGSLLRFSHASLTAAEEPQICTTGDLTWTATRTVPAPATAQRTPVGSTFVRKMGGATITFTRLR